MGDIELYLKVLIDRVNCLLGAVNLSGSIIIVHCKKRSYPLDSSLFVIQPYIFLVVHQQYMSLNLLIYMSFIDGYKNCKCRVY